MSGTIVQVKRTDVPNRPPVTGALLPGELCVEMASPTRLWVGVPAVLDPTQMKLLYDSSATGGGGGNYVDKAGDTMTGFLTLSAPPVNDLHAATKRYVDDLASAGTAGVVSWNTRSGVVSMTSTDVSNATGLLRTGGTMTGFLTLNADPTAPLHAVPMRYVNAADVLLQQEIDILASNLVFVGGLVVPTNTGTYTIASGFTNGALPAAAATNLGYYVIVTTGGTPPAATNIPAATYAVSDWIVSDGAQWIRLPIGEGTTGYVLKTGDTMSGYLTLNADPVNPLHSVTKQYVDTHSGYVSITGDTMTGDLTVPNFVATGNASVAGQTTLLGPTYFGSSGLVYYSENPSDRVWSWNAGYADFFTIASGMRNWSFPNGMMQLNPAGDFYLSQTGKVNTYLWLMSNSQGWYGMGVAGYQINFSAQAGGTGCVISATGFEVANPSGIALKVGGGVWGTLSDMRIKTVHRDYAAGLAEIVQLNPRVYSYTGNVSLAPLNPPADFDMTKMPPADWEKMQVDAAVEFVGLVAQEIEAIFPETISLRRAIVDGVEVSDLRQSDTSPLLYALINAIKTIDQRLSALEPAMRA